MVDDGQVHPANEAAVRGVGGTLLRLDAVTSLGAKLNVGIGAVRGALCAKMDDDDWYAPDYLAAMVEARARRSLQVCTPTIAFMGQFLFFDVASWMVRQPAEASAPGATLVFAREDWLECQFRQVSHHEDMWFLQDLMELGVSPLPVTQPDLFMAVRHRGWDKERGHSWTQRWEGQDLDMFLQDCEQYRSPEQLLPPWAIAAYTRLRQEIAAVPG